MFRAKVDLPKISRKRRRTTKQRLRRSVAGVHIEKATAVATQESARKHKTRRDYMTVSEVAELFHVSSKTVVRWANDGKLPYMATLGGHRRFPRQPIEALVADQQRGALTLD